MFVKPLLLFCLGAIALLGEGTFNGRWSGEIAGRDGDKRPVTFFLKQSGDALSGPMTVNFRMPNFTDAPAAITAHWADLKLSGKHRVRNLWAHTDHGALADEFSAEVPAHSAVFVLLTEPRP